MPAPRERSRPFHVEFYGPTVLVRLAPGGPWDGDAVACLARLLGELPNRAGCGRFLLHLGAVRSLPGRVLDELARFCRAAQAEGGRVELTAVSPELRRVLEQTRLTDLLPALPD